jgi:hypothetical protein
VREGTNAIEQTKTAWGGDALRVRDHLPAMIERGYESLTKVEKDLLNGSASSPASRRRDAS